MVVNNIVLYNVACHYNPCRTVFPSNAKYEAVLMTAMLHASFGSS